MSNPYRVRPTKARVDASHTGYGISVLDRQKPWNPGSMQRPPTDSSAPFQAPPIANQTKPMEDSWDWNVDNGNNGNDSWNWSIEQSEPQTLQQQHHQPQQQQSQLPSNQFIPPYTNQKQPILPPTQDSYYKNLNGNNRLGAVVNQHGSSERETTRMAPPVREPTPKQPDSFPQYPNYSHNQQFSIPSGPNSNTSYSGSIDQLQWPNEQQHSQSLPYTTQNPVHNQKHQTSPLPSVSTNNYNWATNDQQKNVPLHNWQNHTETPVSNYWQESNSGKQEQISDTNSSWSHTQQAHPSQQRIANPYPSSNAINSDHSKFFNPHESSQDNSSTQNWLPQNALISKQWPKSISENVTNVLPRQQSLPSNTWSQAEEANSLPPWQQVGAPSNIPNSQWRQPKLQSGGSLEESALSENNKGDWQQIHPPPSHFNSSTTSTTSGSLANMSSSTEQLEDRKRSLTPTTSCTSLNEFQSQNVNANHSNAVNNTVSNAENVNLQRNVDLDLGMDSEWNSVTDISSGVNNLNLNSKFNHQTDNVPPRKDEQSVAQGLNDWGRQSLIGMKSEKTEITPENIPILTADDNSVENPSTISQEQFDTHQVSNSKSAENVSQGSYDQWYNQSVRTQSEKDFFDNDRHHPKKQWPEHNTENYEYKQNVRTQAENDFFDKDRHHSIKQWLPEQNVENYENIQQPSEFVNLEVVAPESQERDIYGSRDSINKETLDNDQVVRQTTVSKEAVVREFRQEINNVEVPSVQQIQQSFHSEQAPDNYEFASNDRNTFLETGELTDSHSQELEPAPPNQDDENDEVPNDIPFLREVPGQSSSVDPRRNDPTGQEQYAQTGAVAGPPRMTDPRRNDPSGQEQQQQSRPPILVDRTVDRRDVPPGQERVKSIQQSASQPPLQQQRGNGELDSVERRNDPSGRERSLPPVPQQSRNEPSGEEQRNPGLSIVQPEPGAVREIPGQGNEPDEPIQQPDSGLRQIPGGASSNESVQIMPDDRTGGTRVVTGSQEVNNPPAISATQDALNDNRSKREEAVGASIGETQIGSGPPNRRDSYEDGDDEGSGNSRDGSRDRRRETSPKPRHPRYDYNRKSSYYDRDYDDDYYYDRRRAVDYERPYNSREDLDRRDTSYRDDDRRHTSRDDLDRDRHPREDLDRRSRLKEEIDDRDGRRRIDERRRDRSADPRRLDRDGREFDPRYPRDRDYLDRDRDRRRDDRRSRRYPEYDSRDPRENYRREYYDESYARNSRPSSRSSYNDRDRDYYMRTRDPYGYAYNNYPGYDYGSNYNSNYYAYLENLRRTDPAAYAEWYHKYYQHQQQITRAVTSSYPEDRASVHSGRSSCDDRNSSDKRNLTDMSLLEDQTTASSRLTPTKFSTAHTKGSFSIGTLIHVHASYPSDGERAKVDILKMDQLLSHDATLRELRSYPGPLIKGVTHKKTIIEYCENKIKKASTNEDIFEVSSYVLLYELMIMLIQQNGNVVGVDIASLLLRNKDTYPYEVNKPSRETNRRESTISQRSSASGGDKNITDTVQLLEKEEHSKPRKSVEQLTNEFRNTLLYGLVQEALEFAMVEGLWGHALFLASKLDKRTHASVMTRFANSLPPQDPLQTLYQLHSGRVPASVTCVSDSRWDDWRPHLAMVISNTSANPEVNRRSISTLGDTLAVRGDIYAAHFCYILSQVDFGAYGANNVKIVLIGANHHKPYSEFLNTEAIMLTEIYEYARKLSEPFTLVELQTFKFNLAVRMIDYGLVEKAILYIEQVAVNIVAEPEKYQRAFINDVYVLGDRLKYNDPVCKDSDEDAANLPWLNNLAEIVGKCEKGEIVQEHNSYAPSSLAPEVNNESEALQPKWTPSQVDYVTGGNPPSIMTVPEADPHVPWQPKSTVTAVQESYGLATEREVQYSDETVNETRQQNVYQSYQQDYWASQQQSYDQQDYASREHMQSEWNKPSAMQYNSQQQDGENSEHQNKWAYEQQQLPQQPNISMGPSGGKQYDPLEELESLEPSRLGSKPAADTKKQHDKSAEKKQASSSGGSWFGGLFSKLAPKPRNQMILPDDSNPAIVWDPVAKKWMNKEEEDGGGSAPLAPPPKMSELPGFKPPVASIQAPAPAPAPSSVPAQIAAAPGPPAGPAAVSTVSPADETLGMNGSKLITGGGNMYKLNRGRNMRANYVDVMNPGGPKSAAPNPVAVAPTPAGSPAMPMAASSPQLFVPAPVNDPNAPLDFLTPLSTVAPQSNENSQALSRWSSTSSLSREVQSYTMRDPRLLQRDKGPMMYNPMDLKDRSQKSQVRTRYPPR